MNYKGETALKKLKRIDIMKQIIREIGLTNTRKTPAYLSRAQLLELLAIIQSFKTKLQLSNMGAQVNERDQRASGN